MHIWSVGLLDDLKALGQQHFTTSTTFRHFNNGLDLIAALREHASGRLAILLKLQLPVIDGLCIIRLLQQEGWIDKHQFVLSAPNISSSDYHQLSAWKVEVIPPANLSQLVTNTIEACG